MPRGCAGILFRAWRGHARTDQGADLAEKDVSLFFWGGAETDWRQRAARGDRDVYDFYPKIRSLWRKSF